MLTSLDLIANFVAGKDRSYVCSDSEASVEYGYEP